MSLLSRPVNFSRSSWLDALRSDAVFGLRQLRRNPVTSTAAIVSLALAIGACTSAFRLIDAVLLRPLPVADPDRLQLLARRATWPSGSLRTDEGSEHAFFLRVRPEVKDEAELVAVSAAGRIDVTFASDRETEKAYQQYVSGWMFEVFGLRPALGRLLVEGDDFTPGAHPYAVLSYDYWTRRFARDPTVVGRTFRAEGRPYEIVGVSEERFTGTEPGTFTDIFVPSMMHPAATRPDSSWVRTLVQLKPGIAGAPVLARMDASFQLFQEERAKGFSNMTLQNVARFLSQRLLLEPASAGVSSLQRGNRDSLATLGVLVMLVLLIACANVANLLTAQGASRAREMALRLSIGAGRWRLVQLVLVESAWLAALAAAMGALLAWWSAPVVVGLLNPPDNPARVALPADWRVLGFLLALTLGVTCLFGLLPALRASGVRPVTALKGGHDPASRRRVMHAVVALQAAFCVLVLLVAGLFVVTFDRLAHQDMGFSAERLIALETVARPAQLPVYWDEVAIRLRALGGVEAVALSDRPLLDGNGTNSFVLVDGAAPVDVLAFFRRVSPGWIGTMRIPFVDGRDLDARDRTPGAAVVNEAFAKTYFNGQNPVGRTFDRRSIGQRFRIVGLVRDARYRSMREPILPTAYIPFESVDGAGASQPQGRATFIVRTSSPDPLVLASALRREVSDARAEFRVSTIRTQLELNQSHTVRERLMAALASFFACVALALAGVGLYGVLHYSVLQRRREIGLRVALGARAVHIARGVTMQVFAMVMAGAVAGLAVGLAAARYIEELFYEVRVSEPSILAYPLLAVLAIALVAALPPVIHALRIDPATTLRAE